ncbi:hypothetical protein [Saccharothrix sp. NRRL B-16348]|uniref:hypothetical protein n=1 Tax=Saccharothrix sp. NRRL B-16348 TaxID=1415542 RepID=UPI0012FBDE1A|nr:hypothetical protein [Saccharothrix sp. NRRL B-16348]
MIEVEGMSEVPVTASLTARTVGGRVDWSGAIAAVAGEDQVRLLNMRQGRLRLPGNEGEAAEFLVTGTSGPGAAGRPVGRFDIVGNGSLPPF